MEKSLTLVTTEIEDTWPERGGVVFLGEWCRLYSRRERWMNLDGVVLPYHWNDRGKLKSDFLYIERLKKRLMSRLVCELNDLHGINYDYRYWNILLGYWLNIYVCVLYDRWASIESAINSYQGFDTFVINQSKDVLVVNDTADFVSYASSNPYWNHALFGMLLERKKASVNIDYIDINGTKKFASKSAGNGVKECVKSFAKCLAAKVAHTSKYDSYFLSSTYLSYVDLCNLSIRLGQFPSYVSAPSAPESLFDQAMRQWGTREHFYGNEFDMLAWEYIPKLIPKIFVEGFRDLNNIINRLAWPIRPRVIWTSNLHFGSDVFCAWAGSKCASGARFVVGEHGGIGTGAFNSAHSYELSVADLYISTGWVSERYSNIAPVGNFRVNSLLGRLRYRSKGKALLVCGIQPRYNLHAQSMMLSSQVLSYFDDQFRFTEALPDRIRKDILVRVCVKDYEWQQKDRWLNRHPWIAFDNEKRPMWESIGRCRLFIATYNATTWIDALTLNYPTVMYWNPLHWEVKLEAEPYFFNLKKVGIFHDSPISAALHVSTVWDDVLGWWQAKAVQDARKCFCEAYAASPSDMVKLIKEVLKNESGLATQTDPEDCI